MIEVLAEILSNYMIKTNARLDKLERENETLKDIVKLLTDLHAVQSDMIAVTMSDHIEDFHPYEGS